MMNSEVWMLKFATDLRYIELSMLLNTAALEAHVLSQFRTLPGLKPTSRGWALEEILAAHMLASLNE